MEQYISKDALVAEIERRLWLLVPKITFHQQRVELEKLLSFIDTLEVKEVIESKLPNPRFPHLDNIVDKVFGAGNLESFEYEEAEQLVLLAKEELLKDLEVKEVELEKEFNDFLDNVEGMPRMWHSDEQIEWAKDIARHFYGLGLKARKEEVE